MDGTTTQVADLVLVAQEIIFITNSSCSKNVEDRMEWMDRKNGWMDRWIERMDGWKEWVDRIGGWNI